MHSQAFLICFFIYLAAMIWLGWWGSRAYRGSGDDFLLGGRKVPLLLTIGTTIATMVGTGSSMGAVGFGYVNGWAGTLYGLGGAVGILLLAWMFAPVRRLRFMSMAEELSYYVGGHRLVRNLVAVLIYLASIGWLGAHILGGGMYLSWVTGIDLAAAKIIVAIGFCLFCIIGGYMAMVWTDTVQAIVLFVGFIAMAVFSLIEIGGWSRLGEGMDDAALSFLGVQSIGIIPAISLAVVVGVGVLATPSYRQRIYSAASESSVRSSFLVSGLLYLAFSIIPAIIGMAARIMAPDLDNPGFAFPYLTTQVLPLWLGMLVLIAGLSAAMSSATSDAMAGVATLLRDLFTMVTGRSPEEAKLVRYSRIALVTTIAVALAFALSSDDVITYITRMIATVMGGMFVCGVLGRFWPRYNWQGALATLVAGSATSLAVIANAEWNALWGNPILPAVGMAVLSGVVVSLATPRSQVSHEQAMARINQAREQSDGVADSEHA